MPLQLPTHNYPRLAIDPVQLEIIRMGLQAIPDLVETDLTRTAFSPLIYEYKDYAVGLVDAEGRSIALAQHGLPGFLTNILGLAVRDGMEFYKNAIEPGDVIITNHAGTLGQHLNNVVMYTPVFGSNGTLLAFMAVNVHWIDIGGRYPGSCLGTDTTDLWQEGLQLRSIKLFRRGELDSGIARIIEGNTRQPEMLLGDIWAQHAGCVKSKMLFEQLLDRFGEDTVFSAIAMIWDRSADASREAIKAMPEGKFSASSFMDNDGVELDRQIPISVEVEIRDGEFIVDFSKMSSQVKGPFNSGFYGGADASACIAFKYLFIPELGINEGTFAPVRVVAPPGTLISAQDGAPMSYYQTPLSTVVDVIFAAMAPVMPDRVAAGHHGAPNLYGFSGINPCTGKFFNVFDTQHGGFGASSTADGAGPYKTIRHADNKDIPVETLEALYPLLVERMEWRQDSGGAGAQRGGLGINRTVRVLSACFLTLSLERCDDAPWGLFGGQRGTSTRAELEKLDGTRLPLRKVSALPIQAGDRIHLQSAGGGGFGSPRERAPSRVKEDLLEGYVSRRAALDVYGLESGD